MDLPELTLFRLAKRKVKPSLRILKSQSYNTISNIRFKKKGSIIILSLKVLLVQKYLEVNHPDMLICKLIWVLESMFCLVTLVFISLLSLQKKIRKAIE